MPTVTPTATTQLRPPIWRDVRVLRVVFQLVFLAALTGFVFFLWNNLRSNLSARGLPTPTDFDFLGQATGFSIPFSSTTGAARIQSAYFTAAQNTALAAGFGILLCTVLGLLVGVGRLSSNWLVRKASGIWVEAFRNLPPLLLIVFAFNAVFLQLPRVANADERLGGLVLITNRELVIASPTTNADFGIWLLVVLAAAALAIGVGTWRTRVHTTTGAPHHRLVWAGLPFVAAVVVSYLVLDPVGVSRPEVVGRGLAGGFGMNAPFLAVALALAIYTSSHVAEIVRGSIQAVHKGQTEASAALGLSSFQRLRFVIMPQAFRIAIPPTISQYLNLTKNTSLGAAVGFMELTDFSGTNIGNGRPATQTVLLLMAIYLSFSLVISVVLNLYSRHIRLVER